MLPLVLFPLLPRLSQRLAIYLPELATEEGAAISCPVVELDHLVVAVGLGKVVHKTGTIEVGVGSHLEIHRRAFRFQSNYREELVAAIDDTTEIHLIVTT